MKMKHSNYLERKGLETLENALKRDDMLEDASFDERFLEYFFIGKFELPNENVFQKNKSADLQYVGYLKRKFIILEFKGKHQFNPIIKESNEVNSVIGDYLLTAKKEIDFLLELSLSFYPEKPSFVLQDGDVVRCNSDICKVQKSYMDNTYYKLAKENQEVIFEHWININPIEMEESNLQTKKYKRPLLSYDTRELGFIFYRAYEYGIFSDPTYQRDYCWDEDDEIALIDSIMKGRDIGKFVFNLAHTMDQYEVIDGKQRIHTLLRFREGRFSWNGIHYQELNKVQKRKFCSHTIMVSDQEGMKMEEKIRCFLDINATGVPVSKSHLKKVEALIKK